MLTSPGLNAPPEKSGVVRAVSFARPYAVGLLGSLALFTFGWLTWKGRAIIVELCRHFGYDHVRRERPAIPLVTIDTLTAESTRVSIREVAGVDGNVTERELIVIARLVAATGAKNIFELGTFDGRTTLNMASNAGEGARVFTLDLPAGSADATSAALDPHESKYTDKAISGTRYRGTDVEERITQLYGDSGTFDFTPFRASIDFIFVDGSHAYRYVVNDSLHSLDMRSPTGIIAWHDYGRWDGVTRALNDLYRTRPEFENLRQIEGTTLAILRRG
ncbi:MAG TPA: class I SAM-dependent methyltransferase [Gemmatimonadaceae bacterium]|nr:class I SAM-dependent methyltransferase [Gemmatimonadaceae bacterium]